jgi:hypothetical protein
VKKSTAVVLSEAKDLGSCSSFNYLRKTAEMLRCAQHDTFEFFQTFCRRGPQDAARFAGFPTPATLG